MQILARLTLGLLLLLVLYLGLRAAISHPAVLQALIPLLVLSALALVLYGGVRALRATTLSQAAQAADRAAQLHDQMASAYWFAGRPLEQPLVQVLLRRASEATLRHHPRQLLPLRVPKAAWGSLAVALLVGLLAWWSPQGALSGRESQGEVVARGAVPQRAAAQGPSAPAQVSADAAASAQPGQSGTSVAQGERRRFDADFDDEVPAQGGAEGASALLPVAASEAAPAEPEKQTRRGAQNQGAESASEWLGSVISRLKEMMQQGNDPNAGEGVAPTGNARDSMPMGAADNGRRDDAGQANPTPEYRRADTSGMSDLRMNALGGLGPRNTVAGESDGEEQSGRNNSNSGALGRRVGTSRAGAGDDSEAPLGNPGGESPSAPVLGKKTQRLALQLKRVTAQSSTPAQTEDEGTPEAFFSATRAQAARVQAQDVQSTARAVATSPNSGEQTPLAYRAVVKDYFLTQHRKEP